MWNASLGRLTVHALRDIEAGREITISYMSGVSSGYAERQRYLRDEFSFACACELCSLSLPARLRSGRQLVQIRSIDEEDGATTDLDLVLECPAESFRQVRQLFELLEEEGIWDMRILRGCFDAFQIAVVVGDKRLREADLSIRPRLRSAYGSRYLYTSRPSPINIVKIDEFSDSPRSGAID
jgi:hypothetical protein